MRLYREMLGGEPHVHVPELVPELSHAAPADHGLAGGQAAAQLQAGRQEDRNASRCNMFRAWYVPFYDYGVIHGDPHLGNYTVRATTSSSTCSTSAASASSGRQFVKGVIDLYWALARGDRDLAVAAYETWGFTELDQADVIDVLNEWAAFLYGPLLEDRPRLIEETDSGR